MKKTVLCLVLIFMLCSCTPEPKHVHTFATEWTSDAVNHWHVATCDHEEVSDLSTHVWDAGKITTQATCTTKGVRTYTCTVCEQTREEDLGFSHEYGPAVDLGNGVQMVSCVNCGFDFYYAQGKSAVLILMPNNGNKPTYFTGNQGDTVTLPVAARMDYGITSESLHTPREYQFACWVDSEGREYLPGEKYVLSSQNSTLEAKYYINVSLMNCDSRYTQFIDYFDGTNDYSDLDVEALAQTIEIGNSIGIISVKSLSSFAVPSQYVADGFRFVDAAGAEYNASYLSGNDDFMLLRLPEVVSLTYKANGGNGNDSVQKVPCGCVIKTKGDGVFTRRGYVFTGWNTKADGSGVSYSADFEGPFVEDTILYAQWRLGIVSYDANGGEGEMAPTDALSPVRDSQFTLDGYGVGCWNTQSDGGGQTYPTDYDGGFECDTVLYAQWWKTNTVTYVANGGIGTMAPTSVFVGDATTLAPNSLSNKYCRFVNWNTKADGTGTSYEDGYTGVFEEDLTLYAQWTSIGVTGQAGGIIFYDCDADNATGNADGLISAECGWRYLEAAPEDLKVGSTDGFIFGYYRTSPSGSNLYVNGTNTYTEGTSDFNDGKSTGTAIGTGKANTAKLVKAMGSTVYIRQSGTEKTDQYAAKLADDYVYGGYDDWFLPSKDELTLMYTNLKQCNLGGFSFDYWSSSESDYDAYYAWTRYFDDGDQGEYYRYIYVRVRCVRAFTPIEQLDPSTIYLAQTIEPTCTEYGWKVYRFVDTDKEACRVLDKEPTGHTMGSDGYHCSSCGHLMVETGIIGPAGGYVFYDCDEDNATGNADGLISTECGWRYLEVIPEDFSVSGRTDFQFGYYRTTPEGDNLYVNGTTTYTEGTSNPNDGKSTGTAIGTGKANTEKLVKSMGNSTYVDESGISTASQYVAKLVNDCVYGGYDDWFLPSKNELDLVCTTLKSGGLDGFSSSDRYWSSSEADGYYGPSETWVQYFKDGRQSYVERSFSCEVRCVRAFTPIEQLDTSTIYLAETIEPTCTEYGWKVYRFVDTDKEACRVLDKEPTGHTMGTDGYHCSSCGHLMAEAGIIGPAGGYVFYDCDEDNATGNADGLISTECGWRFLEIAPEDLSVGSSSIFKFGYYRKSSSGSNLYVNATNTYTEGTSDSNDGKSTGTAIGTGKANTAKLVKAMGSAAYIAASGTSTTAQCAAKLADDYVFGGCDDWFMPSRYELESALFNLQAHGIGGFAPNYYWSSSESSKNVESAYIPSLKNGGVSGSRNSEHRVRCVRAF